MFDLPSRCPLGVTTLKALPARLPSLWEELQSCFMSLILRSLNGMVLMGKFHTVLNGSGTTYNLGRSFKHIQLPVYHFRLLNLTRTGKKNVFVQMFQR